MESGYIKLYRCLLEHPIWKTSTAEQKVILITLLEMANHAPAKWVWKGKEFEVDRGQMITSIPEIKRAAGVDISDMNVRTALKKFEKVFGFLTDESTHTGRLITIVNYSKWQGLEDSTNRQTNRQLTDSQQTANRQLTANKKNKKNKKNKNNNIYIYSSEAAEIVDFLNECLGTRYKASSEKTRSLIKARLSEGFTVEDFKTVILKKSREWLHDPKMEKFLRPETLFGTKFESYLYQPCTQKATAREIMGDWLNDEE